MTNKEIIEHINSINTFIGVEKNAESPLLTTKGAFIVKRNLKKLMDVYEIYKQSLDDIRERYHLDNSFETESEQGNQKALTEINELLEVDTEIVTDPLTEDEFCSSAKLSDIMLLDFMIIQ